MRLHEPRQSNPLMAKKIRCHCGGKPSLSTLPGCCQVRLLIPARSGYIPFLCPTCAGNKSLSDEDGSPPYPCPTCKAQGSVDPAHPPPAGMFDVLTKILFGA